ncbi:MAG: hypothetical protein JW881_08055 [Spirochaetales bacterium]|nr:hypothetical protein [Spirochaetales bacterium]
MKKMLFSLLFLCSIVSLYSQEATMEPTPAPPEVTPTPEGTPTPEPVVGIDAISPQSGIPGTEIEIRCSNTWQLYNHVHIECVEPGYRDYKVVLERGEYMADRIRFNVPSFMYKTCHYENPPCYDPCINIIPGNYQVRVESHDEISDPVSFSIPDFSDPAPTPEPPQNLDSGTNARRPLIWISWDESPGALGYNIYRGIRSGGPFALIACNYGGVYYEDTDLIADEDYYYVLTAFNENGESALSEEVYRHANPESPTSEPTVAPTISPTAVPVEEVSLTIDITGEGSVYISGLLEPVTPEDAPATLYFEYGTEIALSVLVPTPCPCGYQCQQPEFIGYEGDVVSNEDYVEGIILDRDMAVTANFLDYAPGPTQDPSVTPFPDITGEPTTEPAPTEDPNQTPTQTPIPTISGGTTAPTPLLPTADPNDTPVPTTMTTVSPTQAPAIIMGDANGSGAVDIVDALLVARYYVGMIDDSSINPGLSDVNCSGSIDIVDALLIAQFYVGLPVSFC